MTNDQPKETVGSTQCCLVLQLHIEIAGPSSVARCPKFGFVGYLPCHQLSVTDSLAGFTLKLQASKFECTFGSEHRAHQASGSVIMVQKSFTEHGCV